MNHQDIIKNLPPLEALEAELERRRQNKIYTYFPEAGKYRRELYVKHMEVFRAGKDHRERLFLAANRTGKTIVGAYETAVHLTGLYPPWWEGKRFDRATNVWACNKTAVDCRDINQLELLGQPGQFGTGMIPRDYLIHTKPKPSVPDAIEIIYVKHKSGGQSVCHMKSYDQGREKFQGRAIDFIWPDEEVPDDVYTEMLLRTMTTGGLILCTYTPIMGLTPVTVQFLRDCVNRDKLPTEVQVSQVHDEMEEAF